MRLSCDKMVINEGPKQRLVELSESMDNWGTLREIRIDEIENFVLKFLNFIHDEGLLAFRLIFLR